MNHALIIAIDAYQHYGILYNCKNDAEQIKEVLINRYGFQTEAINLLLDSDATRENIVNTFERYESLNEDDSLLVVFLGHGEIIRANNYGYWVPTEGRKNERSTWYSNTEYMQFLDICPCKHIFTIIGACYSGSIFNQSTGTGGSISSWMLKKSRFALCASDEYSKVPDGDENSLSPFVKTLLKYLIQNRQEYLSVSILSNKVSQYFSARDRGEVAYGHVISNVTEFGQFIFQTKVNLEANKHFERNVKSLAKAIFKTEPTSETIGHQYLPLIYKLSGNRNWNIVFPTRDINQVHIKWLRELSDTLHDYFYAERLRVLADIFVVVENDNGIEDLDLINQDLPPDVHIDTFKQFSGRLFDFESYKLVRDKYFFGSLESYDDNDDESNKRIDKYIPVSYEINYLGGGSKISKDSNTVIFDRIIRELKKDKKRIILTGKYGTGKSRCIKEVFDELSASYNEIRKIPIAINLRECRGLETPRELFNRHFKSIGLSELQNTLTDAVVGNLKSENFIFLIDGFDELLGDSWSTDAQALIEFRKNALLCVKELMGETKSPILVTGREQYFNDFDEMISALGVKDDHNLMHLSCKDEFSDEEMSEYLRVYFEENTFKIPHWLPKRPLICNVIAELDSISLREIFGSSESSISFWRLFLDKLCEREVKIDKIRLNANAVKRLLVLIALKSREKIDMMGSITYQEITQIFSKIIKDDENKDVRGIDDSSSIFVQRLPGLARVEAGSQDRQFVDEFLLSGLRAEALIRQVNMNKIDSFNKIWKQNLTDFAIDICEERIEREGSYSTWLNYLKSGLVNEINNKYIIGDLMSILSSSEVLSNAMDLGSITIYGTFFRHLDLRNNMLQGVTFDDCHVDIVYVSNKVRDIQGVKISNSTIGEIKGVTSQEILPEWLKEESNEIKMINLISNTTEVNASSLNESQKILFHIINRLVDQKGSARKIETLQKGIDKSIRSNKRNLDKILKKLKNENLIYFARGNEGVIVSVTDGNARQRLGSIKRELNTSSDPIWLYVTSL